VVQKWRRIENRRGEVRRRNGKGIDLIWTLDSKRVSKRVSERVSKRVRERVSESVSERVNVICERNLRVRELGLKSLLLTTISLS
jgi:hypothetical protein